MHQIEVATNDKPLAITPFKSYRYSGRYGYIMVAATSDDDAMNEVARSTDEPLTITALEIWSDTAQMYIGVARN